MEAPQTRRWFLLKHEDGQVFGPLAFDILQRWAASAQIAPHDKVSTDEQTWMKAPMVPELGMDWLVEVTSERLYGPTTLGAIAEFLRFGEINDDTTLVNCLDGRRQTVREIAPLLEAAVPPEDTPVAETTDSPAAEPETGRMAIDMKDRIRDLEVSLKEERRTLAEVEQRYRDLEKKFQQLTAPK